jgi:hypothetical protein
MNRKYTKSNLESIVYRQLENLDAMGERIKLLEKQNELLVKYNHKLMEELGYTKSTLIPYPKLKRIQNMDERKNQV